MVACDGYWGLRTEDWVLGTVKEYILVNGVFARWMYFDGGML